MHKLLENLGAGDVSTSVSNLSLSYVIRLKAPFHFV
jgi:hypothetical protein